MKIVICGAGHASLLTAALLAERGHEVQVIEQMERAALEERYCWTDGFEKKLLPVLGLPIPELKYGKYEGEFVKTHYDAPGILESMPLGNTPIIMIDRKALTAYLLKRCEAAGVGIRCGCEATSLLGSKGPELSDIDIKGITVRDETGEQEIAADIVVDATGFKGRLRTTLTPGCINTPLPKKDCLSSYIAMLRLNCASKDVHTYIDTKKYMPKGKKCFSWLIPLDDTHADLGFCVEDNICDEAAAREMVHRVLADYSNIIAEVKSEGGGVIPMCDPVPAIAAKGFMILGDAAAMVNPENGCGISPGIIAAALLMQTICRAKDNSIGELWPYAARWFTGRGAEYAAIVSRGSALSIEDAALLKQNGLPQVSTFMTSWDPIPAVDPMAQLKNSYLDLCNAHPELMDRIEKARDISRRIYAHHLMYPTKWDAAEYAAWYNRLISLREI